MAQFKQWALEYVLADDEPVQLEITKKAAKEIESSRASSTVVGNWAASVQQWMTQQNADDDQMEDGDDGGSGDIIARAKALGFLAGTLEFLDKATLKSDQVLRLLGFFGAMFSYDHKAGITASAKALRQLYSMKGFRPSMGVKILEDVCKIKEDFRLQTAVTRLEVYELFLSLVRDPAVSSELKHKYGSACGFVLDMIEICQTERDPRNLMVWFEILRILLADYDPSPEVTEEIFKVFSAYFPISLRSSATPIGITADDLKEAVRSCFSAHHRVAPHGFPFLLQKLDQGDAVTVAVKLDILKTIKACIEHYENPPANIVPHMEPIWNSLKYEVRNGEVKETIDATLDVLRAIARRLDGTKNHKMDASSLKSYIDLVARDCRDDLGNPTYTKQAGLLLMTVITATVRAYVLYNASFIDIIRQNLRQPKSPSHTRDLILLVNSFLKTRMELFKGRKEAHPDDEESLKAESRSHLEALFHDIYLPAWANKAQDPDSEEREVLKQVTQGLALLVSQQVLQPDGTPVLLWLTLSPNDNNDEDSSLEDEAVLALRTVVINYTDGFSELANRVKAEVKKRDWTKPSEYSLGALRNLLSRFTFIGCSQNWLNEFRQLPADWLLQIRRGDGVSGATPLEVLQEDDPKVYLQFLKLSFFVVWRLYRSASDTRQGPWDERALVQLSQTAALVVQSLDEELQVRCNLAYEAFNLFRDTHRPLEKDSWDLSTGLLTLGILQGLRPGALAGVYEPGGQVERIMCDTLGFVHSPSRESDVLAAIGAVLANKYKGGPSTADPESLLMKRVLEFWGNWLGEAATSQPADAPTFQARSMIAMNILAGAAARQDKHVLSLIPSIHQAIPSPHPNGEILANSLGLLVKQSPFLTPESHSVVKRFYKQWIYTHLAKPLLGPAQPGGSEEPSAAARYRAAVLSVASNCPFAVYQDDLQALIRLLITALTSAVATETGAAAAASQFTWPQVLAALEILVEILTNESEALKGYLREVIGGVTKVYQASCPPRNRDPETAGGGGLAQPDQQQQQQQQQRAVCRRLALQVLGGIPSRFEERLVRAHALPTLRMLAVACGDPVRKVREVARTARGSWAKVVQSE
ncbi:hypothetical protein VTH06DRAFT_2669 [Thermothelomyces fergusii]